jgi:F0F1-type ATP synthase membrane subunit c/vacuolar-type H+-ATPase subunit K
MSSKMGMSGAGGVESVCVVAFLYSVARCPTLNMWIHLAMTEALMLIWYLGIGARSQVSRMNRSL